MNLVIGVVLSSSAVILFAWGFAQHRRQEPARWTRNSTLSGTFTLVLVGLVPAGLGPIIAAVSDLPATLQSINVVGGLVIVVAVAAAIRLAPRLFRAARHEQGMPDLPVQPKPGNLAGQTPRKAA